MSDSRRSVESPIAILVALCGAAVECASGCAAPTSGAATGAGGRSRRKRFGSSSASRLVRTSSTSSTRALEVIGDFIHVTEDERVDVHHNFVAREQWFGRDVHRKGAVADPTGTRALTPGSMGTASDIVEGLGSKDSFGSCSHGAGRVMSRKEARSAVRPDALRREMRRVVYPEHLARHLVEDFVAVVPGLRMLGLACRCWVQSAPFSSRRNLRSRRSVERRAER